MTALWEEKCHQNPEQVWPGNLPGQGTVIRRPETPAMEEAVWRDEAWL